MTDISPLAIQQQLSQRSDLMRLRPHWSDIAQDIVMTTLDDENGRPLITAQEICDNYGMSQAECLALLKLPEFKRLVKDYRRQVSAMGDNASITLRSRMMAASMMEEVFLEARKAGVELKDKIAVMKMLFQYGNLDPATNGQNKAKAESGGGNAAAIGQVIINVPAGIPGMEHLQPRNRVIEGQPVDGDQAS